MRQIQKRYIYSSITSSVFFIIGYGFIDINLWISLILTVVIYIGGIFLFKNKDMRELDATNVNNYYFLASKCANLGSQIKDVEIVSSVNKITTYVDQIIVSLSQRPKKVEQVFDFFDYYLDITYKILYKYKSILKYKKKDANDTEFESKVKDYLSSIVFEFEKQFNNMNEARMIDIESEIRVFEHTVGIKKSDIEVGDKNATK